MKSENEKNFPGQRKSAPKKPYQSPKLSTFGMISQLTQTTMMGMKDDGGSMGNSKFS